MIQGIADLVWTTSKLQGSNFNLTVAYIQFKTGISDITDYFFFASA